MARDRIQNGRQLGQFVVPQQMVITNVVAMGRRDKRLR